MRTSANTRLRGKPCRWVAALIAALMTQCCATSDAFADGMADRFSTGSTSCALRILGALAQANNHGKASDSVPSSASADNRTVDCRLHPWVRQLENWNTQGMPVQSAMQWLMVNEEPAGAIRLHPQLEGPMEDIARMRAAFTLALSGHIADATRLWNDLSMRRPDWAEVWFNLGLAAYQRGEKRASGMYFVKASHLCQMRGCSIETSILTKWTDIAGGAP